jgi:hypothetical protein
MSNKTDKTEEAKTAPEAQPASQVFEALWTLAAALQDVAKAELAKGPGIASNAWRGLYDAVAEIMGDAPMEQATPVPGRPAFVIPPAKRGAVQVPHRPPLAMPPKPRTPIPIGGQAIETPADIRKREDVAAEIERVKRGGK